MSRLFVRCRSCVERGKSKKKNRHTERSYVESEFELENHDEKIKQLHLERRERRGDEDEEGEDGDEEVKGGSEDDEEEEDDISRMANQLAGTDLEGSSKKQQEDDDEEEGEGGPVVSEAQKRRDLARLAEVRRRREEARKRKEAAQEREAVDEAERKRIGDRETGTMREEEEEGDDLPVLSSREVKKLGGKELRKALTDRGLPATGNKRDMQQRLIDHEKDRS